jgi:hypothetical protein
MGWRTLTESMGKWVLGLPLLCSVAYVAGLFPLARFEEESVNIVAHPASIGVNGSYLFENVHRFPIRQTLTFPVATGKGLSPPATMLVHRIDSGAQPSGDESPPAESVRPVPVHNAFGVRWFMIVLRPKEKVWFIVTYTQNAPSHQGGYIVTSTRSWGRPLDKAVFRLRTEGVEIVESNYRLEKLSSAHTLGFQRHSFMPSEDWTFAWEVL